MALRGSDLLLLGLREATTGTITVVDAASGEVRSTAAIPGHAEDLAAGPDGVWVVATEPGRVMRFPDP